MKTACFTVLMLLWAGCGTGKFSSPQRLYEDAEGQRRSGNLSRALDLCGRGVAQWRAHPASEWSWKFRLLESDILLDSGALPKALAVLEEQPAASAPSAQLRGRLLLDIGSCKLWLSDRVTA